MAEFINANGQAYRLKGLTPGKPAQIESGVIADWKEKGKTLPEVPTYTIDLPGGATETHKHDETTLRTSEDHAAWDRYQAARAEYDKELNRRILNAIMLSVDVDPGALESWEAESKFLGIRIPADPIAKKLAYVESEVISAVSDIARLMTRAFVASELAREEDIAPAEAAFQGAMEELHAARKSGS